MRRLAYSCQENEYKKSRSHYRTISDTVAGWNKYAETAGVENELTNAIEETLICL